MNEPWSEGELLDDAARALYLALLADGGLFRVDEVSPADLPALGRLLAARLVSSQLDGSYWTVMDPRAAAGRLGAELRAAGARLLAQAEEPPPQLAELIRAYDREPAISDARAVVRQVTGKPLIQQRLEHLALETGQEMLMAQPGGARPAAMLPHARRAAREWRERGLELRTIYQPGARLDPPTAAYAAYASGLGARIRVLDEDFRRMLIMDRRIAVVAGGTEDQVASFVEDPVLVSVLVDAFERDWARAERVRWEEPAAVGDDPLPALPALLAQGMTQRQAAARLGLSERTVAAQIARLRAQYDAETLFQLGWQLRGVGDD
ncbi:hypothetical protein GCM10009665_15410 [Kitasatospora nipponensis]|uniref:Regulatory LuxR family protein n=1 Tax=Kitasatospora nipponensis TaxID=258049 RepID=A0ABN1VZR1_9ACTN